MITSSRPKPHRPPSPLKLNCSLILILPQLCTTLYNSGMKTGNSSNGSIRFPVRSSVPLQVNPRWSVFSRYLRHILRQRCLRTSDKNFENILFANVNFEVFDAELRKRKQPDSDDDDANEWWNKSISNVFFVLKNGEVLKNSRDFKKKRWENGTPWCVKNGQKQSDRNLKTAHVWFHYMFPLYPSENLVN